MSKKLNNSDELSIILKLLEESKKEGIRLQGMAEKRVAFFLVITSAIITFLARSDFASNPINLLIPLIILLIYGIETLQFLNWNKIDQETNEVVSQDIVGNLRKISEVFNSAMNLMDNRNEKIPEEWNYNIRGGLAEFMYLSNALLFGAILYIPYRTFLVVIPVSLLFIWAQFKFSQRIRSIHKEKKK